MKYRVVTDMLRGFSVQYRRDWWPFWTDAASFAELQEAKDYVRRLHFRHEERELKAAMAGVVVARFLSDDLKP